MNSGPQRAVRAAVGPPEPVGPSLMVRTVIRPMTKVLNPLVLKLAGRSHFGMAAQIRHVGRRSGRPYTTPVTARRTGDLVLIALTFGNRSDWCRNVTAAGGCSIRIDGEDYDASQPEFLIRQEAKPLVAAAFSPFDRLGFRMLGIRQILCMRLAARESISATS